MTIENKFKQDLRLLKKISTGDKEAFQELYESTHEKVYYYLVRFVGHDNAEDILIETFTQVWEKSASFKGRSKAGTWIISIARNLALKDFRKNKRYLLYDNLEPLLNSDHVTDNEVESRNRKQVLKRALLKLGSKHQEVLDLFFYHQMSYGEIASTMEIPMNTVKTRIYYAKNNLKKVLKDMGVDHEQI